MESEIILASGSRARQTMLLNAGVEFTTQTATTDEKILRDQMISNGERPADIALALAAAKAQNVSGQMPGALVIGADQIVEHDGAILGKVSTVPQARTRLRLFRSSAHRLLSAVVVVRNKQVLWQLADGAEVRFRQFSDDYLNQYLECAGAEIVHSVTCYELEGAGSRLMSSLKGDYFTVLGLPLIPLLNYLSETEMIKG